MASVVISGDTSGTATLQAQAVAGNTTLTLPTTSGTLITTASGQTLTSPTITGAVMNSMASSVITSGTAQASTSVASINFTGLPSWVKRITVMLSGVSTNGSSNLIIQLGAGSIVTTGYTSVVQVSSSPTTFTNGFGIVNSIAATSIMNGSVTICLLGSNIWVESGNIGTTVTFVSAGSLSLGGTLDRIRITTVTGTDVFDGGTINILYE